MNWSLSKNKTSIVIHIDIAEYIPGGIPSLIFFYFLVMVAGSHAIVQGHKRGNVLGVDNDQDL